MKVGFFAPLPPARTGVADYAEALLRGLRQIGKVEVDARSADIDLYQLGNNHLHREIYRRALQEPGVVVLHDAVLHHFFLGSLSESEYVEEFQYNYGVWSQDLARELWGGRARSATDPRYFRYPMLKRIAETAKAVVVHNPAAGEMVRQHAPGAHICEIPHLWEAPALPPVYEVERLRRQLGCDGRTLLCGVFGHLRESKRIPAVLRAIEQVRGPHRIILLIAGEFASTDLARSLEPVLAREGVIRTGYLPETEFWRHACAVDLAINLRYPAAGETSGIATRLMGIGKPVIVTQGLEISNWPRGSYLAVDAGAAEQEMLAAYLVWAATRRGDLEEMGRHGAEHVRSEHSLERVAQAYWNLLDDCYHKS